MTPVGATRDDEVVRALSEVAGGPEGDHSRGHRWWTPVRVLLALTAIVFALGMVQKTSCFNDTWADGDTRFTHMCYSDLPYLYTGRGLAELAWPYSGDPEVRERYAGRHVAVVGSGASAHQAVVELAALAEEASGTRVTWLVRRHDADGVFGGEEADELPGRGALGSRARAAASSAYAEVVTGFRTAALEQDGARTTLVAQDGRRVVVDRVVAVTGFRPDHAWLAQVHLDLDGELSAPRDLAPEIHPAFHSCGTVSPHGAALLRQPEGGLYLVGMKSYGRAPSFLALTGYEQVRSVVAEVAGDHEAASRVDLVLPETGVCGVGAAYDGEPSGCCAPVGA